MMKILSLILAFFLLNLQLASAESIAIYTYIEPGGGPLIKQRFLLSESEVFQLAKTKGLYTVPVFDPQTAFEAVKAHLSKEYKEFTDFKVFQYTTGTWATKKEDGWYRFDYCFVRSEIYIPFQDTRRIIPCYHLVLPDGCVLDHESEPLK